MDLGEGWREERLWGRGGRGVALGENGRRRRPRKWRGGMLGNDGGMESSKEREDRGEDEGGRWRGRGGPTGKNLGERGRKENR